jgi:hypothetical protein
MSSESTLFGRVPVSDDRITYDYPVNAARALRPLGSAAAPFRFVFVSGNGADESERVMRSFEDEGSGGEGARDGPEPEWGAIQGGQSPSGGDHPY